MPFCISTSPEEFQRRLSNTLEGLEGASVVTDGKFRASEFGEKFNKKKCRFDLTEQPHIWHILTSEGVEPDLNKVCEIIDKESPRNSEVRRFTGRVNYMANFMPTLSVESEALRRLLNLPDKKGPRVVISTRTRKDMLKT